MIINAGDYNIFLGNKVWENLEEFVNQPEYKGRNFFIMVDENTFKHCLPSVLNHVESLQDAEIIEVANGEENKNIDVCIQVWSMLSEKKADRKSLFINLGGGVIGDMGGFIAATYKRGIDFINIPTTLLAQVDASIGGKVGIDLNGYKNQVGLFANPKAIFVYPNFLNSLDRRQILSGFAEVIKHALICDEDYWKSIKNADIDSVSDLTSLIVRSVEIKNDFVTTDPFEEGERKALNFGHTIGHAIETFSLMKNKLPLLHGEAIAVGMVCEAYLSKAVAGLPEAQLKEITSFIKSKYPPFVINKSMDDYIVDLMMNDKKNEYQKINFTLLKNIGEAQINYNCSETLIKEAIQYYRTEFNDAIRLN